MTPEKLFHELLGLGLNWRVEECEFKREEGVVSLLLGETGHLWESERCPESGGRVKCYDHVGEMVWRHLNIFAHRCEIRGRRPRGRCETSGKVYRVAPPWEGLSKHFTKAFEAMALRLLREMPVAAAGRSIDEPDTRLWRMLKAPVAAAYPQADWSQVTCVGCAEMSVRKGHHSLSVFCELVGKRVLFAVPGKDKKVWQAFGQALGEPHGRPGAIQEVSIDMSPAYIAGVKENIGAQAQVVFDKFQVIAHVNDAVDHVRRQEMRFGGWATRNDLKKTRWIWLKNPGNLNEKPTASQQRLEGKNLRPAKAYQMRRTLQDIDQIPHAALAKKKLLAWCR